MYSVKTILHPTDFSEGSQQAFELACNMAAQHGARVILLHVVAPPAPAPMPYEAAAVHSEALAEDEIHAKLEQLRSSKPELTMDYVVEQGNASDVIIQVAKQAPCDAIVLGTHGRSGLSRLLMGSVAEKVVRKAPCPVITVKQPMGEERESPLSQETMPTNS